MPRRKTTKKVTKKAAPKPPTIQPEPEDLPTGEVMDSQYIEEQTGTEDMSERSESETLA